MKIENEVRVKFAKILIDGHIHLCFKYMDFVTFHSWYEISGQNRWKIELSFKDSPLVLLEYDTEEKWKEILKNLDQIVSTISII